MSSFTIGILSMAIGAASIYFSRSFWLENRLKEKYEGSEEPEEQVDRIKRDWMWIGLFWILFGAIQLVIGL